MIDTVALKWIDKELGDEIKSGNYSFNMKNIDTGEVEEDSLESKTGAKTQDVFVFALGGLMDAINLTNRNDVRLFMKLNKGKLIDVYMQAIVDRLSNDQPVFGDNMMYMWDSYLAGFDIVLDHLDRFNPRESKKVNSHSYEGMFALKYRRAFGEISDKVFEDFFDRYYDHVKYVYEKNYKS